MKALRWFAFPMFLLFLTNLAIAQKQGPAPRPQTARQALLEMLDGGSNAISKHLTVEVQETLKQPENRHAVLIFSTLESLKSQAGEAVQTFDSGPVLLSASRPRQHQKLEVRVDNDDLNGDEDTMQLSLHTLQDGQEQQEMWDLLSSHFDVTMIRQQGTWRLSNFGVGLKVPLGNPEFLKNIASAFYHPTGVVLAAPSSAGEKVTMSAPETIAGSFQATQMRPEQLVAFLGVAESSFARQHPDKGFTCSLPDLAKQTTGLGLGLEEQISSGIYSVYKLGLSGCQGQPAGSFQLFLQPISAATGSKAYCVDATQNVRIADDGLGATCLTSGRPENAMSMVEADDAGTSGKPKE